MSVPLDVVFAALADPTRRAILSMLLEDDMAVTDVAAGFDISLAAISKHLGALARARLITQEKRGRVVWCKLEPDALREASVWMQGFGQFDGPDLDALEVLLDGLEARNNTTRLDDLLAQERRVWDALVTGDTDADAAALHPAFLGVYPSGVARKADHVGQLADGPSVAHYRIEAPRALDLAADTALLSYRAIFARPGGTEEAMMVSSIWRHADGSWINIFSQDTPLAAPTD